MDMNNITFICMGPFYINMMSHYSIYESPYNAICNICHEKMRC